MAFTESTRWRLGGPSTREADIRVGDARVSIPGRAPAGAGAVIIVHVDDVHAYYERVRSVEPDAAPGAPVTQPQGEADPPQPNAS